MTGLLEDGTDVVPADVNAFDPSLIQVMTVVITKTRNIVVDCRTLGARIHYVSRK